MFSLIIWEINFESPGWMLYSTKRAVFRRFQQKIDCFSKSVSLNLQAHCNDIVQVGKLLYSIKKLLKETFKCKLSVKSAIKLVINIQLGWLYLLLISGAVQGKQIVFGFNRFSSRHTIKFENVCQTFLVWQLQLAWITHYIMHNKTNKNMKY